MSAVIPPADPVMYTAHFGLAEPPFSITPDPRYLYMSERHREALAHLVFGIGEGGGFVQLTGEVGTGKTTVCRCLLEQLPPQVDAALILNPRLTATELLAAICDELRVAYDDAGSAKRLVDLLYRHLLDAHARGRRTVLIVDEAQDLAPDVLEQVRLLTNLETATRKLMQIILIGQPELVGLLDRADLRQVAQRVTARYHLLPFSPPETVAYVRHRLGVAGQRERIFGARALREVHRLSRGVPRLINVICDRALLGAFADDRDTVEPGTVRRAAAEVFGHRVDRPGRRWRALGWLAAAAVLAVGAAAALGARPPGWLAARLAPVTFLVGSSSAAGARAGGPPPAAERPPAATSPPAVEAALAPAPEPVAAAAATPRKGPAEPGAPAAPRLADLLADRSVPGDKRTAFVRLYGRWRQEYPVTPSGLACEGARQVGLRCLFRSGTWETLRRFDLPAVIELTAPTRERRYATVTALDEQTATLEFGRHTFTLPLAEIDPTWNGFFIALWKPPAVAALPIGPGRRGKDVDWLRARLQQVDGEPVGGSAGLFDEALRARVMAFQTRRSLAADGIVGEETLTLLTAAVRDPRVPSLSAGVR